ncbi:Os09g0123400, partial [Oryza sativa Japonica Group]
GRRCYRDVFWLVVLLFHLLVFVGALAVTGLNRFAQADRFTNLTATHRFTESLEPVRELLQRPTLEVEEVTPLSSRSRSSPTMAPRGCGVYYRMGMVGGNYWEPRRKDAERVVMRAATHNLTTYLTVVSFFFSLPQRSKR